MTGSRAGQVRGITGLGALLGVVLSVACHDASGRPGHESRPAAPAAGSAAAKDRDGSPGGSRSSSAETAAGSEPQSPELPEIVDPPGLSAAALASWKPPADEPPEVTELKQNVLRGSWSTKTLKDLQKLTHKYPKNEELPYLLGQLYFAKLWVGDGLKSFRSAIQLNPIYRANPFLLRAAISGLGNDSDYSQVRRFLLQDIGPPAAPYLEEVLYGEWRAQVKERAATVLREIQ